MTSPSPYYSDDAVTLYHGDALELLPELLPGLDVAAVVADPPYGIGWKRGANPKRADKGHAGILGDRDTTARDAVLELLHDTPAAVFGSFYAPYPAGVRQVLVWAKPADAGVIGSTTGYRRDVEPVFLVGPWPQRAAAWSSVLRPGAGSAARQAEVAGHPHAKDLGRRAVGIELDEAYCERAARRLSQDVLDLGDVA